MKTTLPTERDERTVAVENASYRWSYLVLSFGILILVAYRSYVKHESAWDFFLLVVLGGVVGRVYQGSNRVLSRRWVIDASIVIAVAAVTGALIAWLMR